MNYGAALLLRAFYNILQQLLKPQMVTLCGQSYKLYYSNSIFQTVLSDNSASSDL